MPTYTLEGCLRIHHVYALMLIHLYTYSWRYLLSFEVSISYSIAVAWLSYRTIVGFGPWPHWSFEGGLRSEEDALLCSTHTCSFHVCVISQREPPRNTPSRPGIEPKSRREQRVSYIHSPTGTMMTRPLGYQWPRSPINIHLPWLAQLVLLKKAICRRIPPHINKSQHARMKL